MKFPSLVKEKFCTTIIDIFIEKEGLNEYGEPSFFNIKNLKCNYNDSAKTIYTKDKKIVKLSGIAYFNGDICKDVETISSGYVEIFGIRREIFSGMKARNPDGSVNYTRLDLI